MPCATQKTSNRVNPDAQSVNSFGTYRTLAHVYKLLTRLNMWRSWRRVSDAEAARAPGGNAAGRRRLPRAARCLRRAALPRAALRCCAGILLAAPIGCQMAPGDTTRQPDTAAQQETPGGANGELPALSIGDASMVEGAGGGSVRFEVRLEPASASVVTVRYETVDGTAKAGLHYTAASGTLTFAAGATAAVIEVAILSAAEHADAKTFTVMLSHPSGARLADAGATATGTITDGGDTVAMEPGGPTGPVTTGDTDPPELSSLTVTGAGAGTLYPAFEAGTLHYALACGSSPTLTVAASTGRAGARLTLLRADRADNVVSAEFSRAVEYDLSSGTQAEYLREYRLPAAHGHFPFRGGVHVLEEFGGSVHWLINWGGKATGPTVDLDQTIAVSEVDPATGTAHLELTMYEGSRDAWSYRAYRIPESAVDIPLTLP